MIRKTRVIVATDAIFLSTTSTICMLISIIKKEKWFIEQNNRIAETVLVCNN